MRVNAFKQMRDKIIYIIFRKVDLMYLKRLKDLREDMDAKQVTIAELLKITRQQYSLYELGKRDIPAEYLRTLAKFYNTSTDYILELTDEIKPYKRKK